MTNDTHGASRWRPGPPNGVTDENEIDRGRLSRFFARVSIDPLGCWEWIGAVNHAGYPSFWHGGNRRSVRGHRFLFERVHGPVPPGLELDHLCNNRRCVRPDHLRTVTHRENTLRSDNPCARNARKTECANGHPFSIGNTRLTADGQRVCLTCQRDRMSRFLARYAGVEE